MGIAGRRASRARWLNWIVALAMLFGALAPTISVALPGDPGSDAQLTTICTPTGLKFVEIDVGGEEPSERPAVEGMADCPFCLLAHHILLPTMRPHAALAQLRSYEPFLLATAVPAAIEPRHPAQPRAPPVLL